jgi:hypothetical protein
MIKTSICISLAFIYLAFYPFNNLNSQCCAIGGGNPLAGDVSQGVLQHRQIELNSNFQYVNTNRFLTENKTDTNYLERFSSQYLYTRLGIGVTERFTMSVEAGYWLDKNQVGLLERDSYRSSGIGDLILLPRYNLIKGTARNRFTNIVLGMGVKIPLGSYNDSIGHLEPFSGEIIYTTKPPAVQATSGAQDILFNVLYSGRLPVGRLQLSANFMYILKGWNPLGERLGDYTSLGIFVGRNLGDDLNIALQLRAEWIDQMQLNNEIRMYSFTNYDPEATGSRKVFVAPQLSYVVKNRFTVFAQSEIPVYQYVNKTQIASQTQFTIGLSYRFLLNRNEVIDPTISH